MRYHEILSQLTKALEFCSSLNLAEAVEVSRFRNYQTRIERLCEIIQKDPLAELPKEIAEELKDQNLEYVLSLTESMEFVDGIAFLKTCPAEITRRKIAKVLAGPLLPNDEDENSNEARNTLFELNMAARLNKAGISTLPGVDSDVECEINGRKLLIECKRPFRERNVAKQIRKAGKQLKTRLTSTASGSRGIVAVSLSKTLNRGDKFLVYTEESRAKEALSRRLEGLAERVKNSWIRLGKDGVIGILFHVVTASLDRKNDRYNLGEQINAHPLAPDGSADYGLFERLSGALASLEH
jgi:hypothetical protein